MDNKPAARPIIDISLMLHAGMHVFEGNPEIRMERQQSLANGDEANVSRLEMGVHTGTHVDAPVHFLEGGRAVEDLPLEELIGEAFVVDASAVSDHLDATALASLVPSGARRVLFKTRNSELWAKPGFSRDFQGMTAEGAAFLVKEGVSLAGWDYLSVGPFGDAVQTHCVLLEAGIVILEGIDLRNVTPGRYELICLPLLLRGSDGAPARAVLRPL